jgi:arginyl-tRNA synthetase
MLSQLLEQRLRQALLAIVPDADAAGAQVRPCLDPKLGDYQTNALMALAKARKMNPRQLAALVVEKLDVTPWCEKVEIAGAGFVNFRLRPSALAEELAAAARGEHLFFQKTAQPHTAVIDFSSPNVAKPMHVGHIRSTFLGECLARVLRLLGHHVITDNHLGDWGTQFGKLLVGWKTGLDPAALAKDPIAEMERLYKKVNAECEADPLRLEQARQELVKLQQGDAQNLDLWRQMIALSQRQFDTLYGRLGVKFDHTLGESFYNPRLPGVVEELTAKGIARESDGAMVVFFDDLAPLKAHPAIIRKSDGAANYATTDLATLAYRLAVWHPAEVVYVTDGRQQLHFQQIFAIFQRWHPEAKMKLAHVWFGSILGEDNKPFKTRSGETVKLADLLDEAEERAFKVVSEKNPELPDADRRNIARVVGLGAIRYADLLPNRQSDYVFSWDKMLALNGNTAPYLQYAYARLRSIFRKGNVGQASSLSLPVGQASSLSAIPAPGPAGTGGTPVLQTPEEIALAKHLLNFGLTLEAVAEEYRPNFLCNYLYDLAGHFTRFYENCPVLKAEEPLRSSRLTLCDLTGRVLKQGLDVLGIEVLEQM